MTPETAALHRAVPFTRLVDGGMDSADARTLLADTSADGSWERVASALADAQHARSERAQRAQHPVTALEAARHCVAARTFAQLARNADDDVKRELYARVVAATARVAELSDGRLERLEVGYRDGRLVGWLCLPSVQRARATVLVWGGLSSWGVAYLPIADALTRRGLACVLVEGPGQGESRLVHGVHADERVVDGFAAFVDAVLADPRLGGRVGIQGNSFGGLFAALLASEDDRIGACIVNGAPPAPGIPPFRTAREQLLAVLGQDDERAAARTIAALHFDPRRRRIGCPLLVLHGGADPLVTRAEQAVFVQAAAPSRGELREWADGEHTLYNHAEERNALTADWFADRLRVD